MATRTGNNQMVVRNGSGGATRPGPARQVTFGSTNQRFQQSELLSRLQRLERAAKPQPKPKPKGQDTSVPRAPRAGNSYATALLNPITGPLVGVPTTVPVQTFVTRVKCSMIVTSATGLMTASLQPVFMLSSDGSGGYTSSAGYVASSVGPLVATNTATAHNPVSGVTAIGSAVANAPYASSDFAAKSTTSNIRGRVVSAMMRVCNTSAPNDRNGTYTCYVDPGHNTVQGLTSSDVAKNSKSVRYPASSEGWHSVMYHPVDPDEVEGWVLDPYLGPSTNAKVGTWAQTGANDGTPFDLSPGYMGVWWNGDATKSQTFLVEAYAIVEYIGTKAMPMVRDNPAVGEVPHKAHALAESSPVFKSDTDAPGSGHPKNSVLHMAQDVWHLATSEQGKRVIGTVYNFAKAF